MEFDATSVSFMAAGLAMSGGGFAMESIGAKQPSKADPERGSTLTAVGAASAAGGSVVTALGMLAASEGDTYVPGITVGLIGFSNLPTSIMLLVRGANIKSSLVDNKTVSSTDRTVADTHATQSFVIGGVTMAVGVGMVIGGVVIAYKASSEATATGPRNTFVAGAAKLLAKVQPTVFQVNNSGASRYSGPGFGIEAAF